MAVATGQLIKRSRNMPIVNIWKYLIRVVYNLESDNRLIYMTDVCYSNVIKYLWISFNDNLQAVEHLA